MVVMRPADRTPVVIGAICNYAIPGRIECQVVRGIELRLRCRA
jgi:hypothetical protein